MTTAPSTVPAPLSLDSAATSAPASKPHSKPQPKGKPKGKPRAGSAPLGSDALVSLFLTTASARDAAIRAIRSGAPGFMQTAETFRTSLDALGAVGSVCLTTTDAALLGIPMRGNTGPNGPVLVAALCGDRITAKGLSAFRKAHKAE